MSETAIPACAHLALWSYDIARLDMIRDRAIIIKNVLDFGTKEATDWVRQIYTAEDIREVIIHTPRSSWDKKSLALWTLLYSVEPARAIRLG